MAPANSNPNVIVVMTTQWRGQATGYAGDGNAATPVLDALAEQSLDFYQAVTPHPFGIFARAAFLTGVACPENGVADYYDPLPREARTLAHAFGERGYETGFFGKWQLYERDPESPVVGEAHALVEVPEDRRGGFSHWEGFESGFLLNDGYYHGSGLGPLRRIEGYQSDVVVDHAGTFLKERSGESPVFAVVSLDAPHPPYGANAAGVKPPPADWIALPPEVPEDAAIRDQARTELAGYYAHIEATDRAIGKLIAEVRESLNWEDTLFVFTSVHGDMHGSHGKFRKGWPHEESVRVPLLLSWPKRFPVARRDPLMISLLDLGPTLLGMCFGQTAWDRPVAGGANLSKSVQLLSEGPEFQEISMPSCPPFDKQCPYAWRGRRFVDKTEVDRDGGARFTLDH